MFQNSKKQMEMTIQDFSKKVKPRAQVKPKDGNIEEEEEEEDYRGSRNCSKNRTKNADGAAERRYRSDHSKGRPNGSGQPEIVKQSAQVNKVRSK